ncbi:ferrous iron transport protein A [Mycoplasmatota bacterium]|nr:ferrous iron transport protein A [Mycoplasmatota bacterium]
MNQYKSIFNMSIGETGIIIDMETIDKSTRHRFMDLGIAPYAKIKLLNKVNFNQLYIIEVDDVEICIRQKYARMIIVQNNN